MATKKRMMKRFAQGGDTYQTARRARKEADIESDYQKALKAGKNAQIALAKKEQRMADAADDFAKWTRADRSQTRAAESAAEAALKEARRTQGRSISDRDLGQRINPTADKPIDLSGVKMDVPSVKASSARPAPRRTAPVSRPASRPQASAPTRAGVTYSGDALKAEQDRLAGRDALRRLMGRSMTPGSAPEEQRVTTPSPPAAQASSDRAQNLQAQVRRREQARRAGSPFSLFGMFTAPSQVRAAELSRMAQARRQSRVGVAPNEEEDTGYKKGGTVKKAKPKMAKKPVKKSCGGMAKYAKGGSIDGCAVRGKTRARTK